MYLPREEGQGLVEYALILVLVAVVVIATLWNLRGAVAVGTGSVVMWIVGLAPFIVLLFAATNTAEGTKGTLRRQLLCNTNNSR